MNESQLDLKRLSPHVLDALGPHAQNAALYFGHEAITPIDAFAGVMAKRDDEKNIGPVEMQTILGAHLTYDKLVKFVASHKTRANLDTVGETFDEFPVGKKKKPWQYHPQVVRAMRLSIERAERHGPYAKATRPDVAIALLDTGDPELLQILTELGIDRTRLRMGLEMVNSKL